MAILSASEITTALARFPDGATIVELNSALGDRMSIRTLQRMLADLEKANKIRITGRARATRYHLLAMPLVAEVPTAGEAAILLSAIAKETLAYVNRPIDQRPVAGYQRGFLFNYEPNSDEYLSAAERSKLYQLGHSARHDEPAGTYARQILQRLLIDLSWNSSRLEGNTYSLLDTQRLLSEGKAADEKTTTETQMILNHKDAIEFLVDGAAEIGINRYTLLNLHALLSNNLLPDPTASGRLRRFPVGITDSTYQPPGLAAQVEEYFDFLLKRANAIQDPFEQGFFLMVQLPYLQPFEDVNKRVSRLAANIPLNRHNLAPLSFVDVPQDLYIKGLLGVYERNHTDLLKDVFIYAYERSAARYAEARQTLGEPDPFRLRLRDAIRQVISEIVTRALSAVAAQEHIREYARQLPEGDRENFVNVVEAELLGLHEGNFARYRITPSQFSKWQAAWAEKDKG